MLGDAAVGQMLAAVGDGANVQEAGCRAAVGDPQDLGVVVEAVIKTRPGH